MQDTVGAVPAACRVRNGGAGKNYSFVQHVHSARQSTGYAPVGNHSRVFHTEHDGFS